MSEQSESRALAEDLCRRICDLLGEPRVLVPGEVNALLSQSPQFARMIAEAEARGAGRVREAVERVLDERDEIDREYRDEYEARHPGNRAAALITTAEVRAVLGDGGEGQG